MKNRVKARLPLLFIFYVLMAGIGILTYPMLSDWISVYTAKIEIADYTAALEKEDTSEIEAMLKKAQDYNKALSEGDEESVASYDELLAVTDAIGYLEIPKINVYMPIYHGIDTEVLERGIGHMPDTSLPVGGISTHCVLSGHTGLPAAKILTDLDQMKEGDLFYIHVLNETLAYKVDQIKVVLPEETDDIRIVPGKDYVTLLTCTPYGVNSHRLLVRGERTEYVPEEDAAFSGWFRGDGESKASGTDDSDDRRRRCGSGACDDASDSFCSVWKKKEESLGKKGYDWV